MTDFYKTKLDGSKVIYTDFDFNLAIHPITKDFVMRNNEKAIMQSLKNCVMASEGDFPMEGDIGGGLDKMFFENNDIMLRFNSRRKIEETISNHEPRIGLQDVSVIQTTQNSIDISVKFMYANNPNPVVENISITRSR